MKPPKYVPIKPIDTKLQNERIDTMRANIERWNISQSVQEKTSEIVDSPDIVERKQALEACSWMSEEQKSKVTISEKGITIQGIGTLALNDEPDEMNYEDALKVWMASKDSWNTIINFIWWTRGQKPQFFRQVLKMDKTYYRSSSAYGNLIAFKLALHDDYVGSIYWYVKNYRRIGDRAFKNF